jgi:hypothetical protein
MAVLLGSITGSTLIIWIFAYIIYKFGPKNTKINFALQVAVGALLTFATVRTFDGITSEVIVSYIGLILALVIMLVIMSKKKIEKKDLK